jgi:hypothetical protein
MATQPANAGLATAPPKVLVKTYLGRQAEAAIAFKKDAAKLAEEGYFPTSQVWAAGSHGCGAFLGALLLCLLLIGIIVFIYLLIVPPPGTLTVTYELRAPASAAVEEKVCPRCAETVKGAALVCRFCGHEFPQPPTEHVWAD